MDYKAELEQRIDEEISHEQWLQLKERVNVLNDGTILPSTQEQQDDLLSEGTLAQNEDEAGSTVTQKLALGKLSPKKPVITPLQMCY